MSLVCLRGHSRLSPYTSMYVVPQVYYFVLLFLFQCYTGCLIFNINEHVDKIVSEILKIIEH